MVTNIDAAPNRFSATTGAPGPIIQATSYTTYTTGRNTNLSNESAEQLSGYPLSRSQAAATLQFFVQASNATGRAVVINPHFSYLPVLIDRDEHPIFLYQFIEALDGITDYDQLEKEFPGLSFTQIAGAIAFLRKVAQFNPKGVDIDNVEDEWLESNKEFRRIIEKALNDEEVTHVHSPE